PFVSPAEIAGSGLPPWQSTHPIPRSKSLELWCMDSEPSWHDRQPPLLGSCFLSFLPFCGWLLLLVTLLPLVSAAPGPEENIVTMATQAITAIHTNLMRLLRFS